MRRKLLIPLLFLIGLVFMLNFVKAQDFSINQVSLDYTNGLSNRNPARITVWDYEKGNTTDLIVYAYTNTEVGSGSSISYTVKIYDSNLTLLDTETFSISKGWNTHHDYIAIIGNAQPESYLDGFWIIGMMSRYNPSSYFYHYAYVYFYNYTSMSKTLLGALDLDRWKYINSGGYSLWSSGIFSNTVYVSNTHYVLGFLISHACYHNNIDFTKREMFMFKLTPSSASIVHLSYGTFNWNQLYAIFMLPLPSNPDSLGIMLIGEDKVGIYSYTRSTDSISDTYSKQFNDLDQLVMRGLNKKITATYDNKRWVPLTKVRHLQTSSANPNVLTGALPFASVGMGKSALMWFDMLINSNGEIQDARMSAVYYISGITYQVDLYGSQVSATYWYNALTGKMFVANYQAGSVTTQVVNLGDLEPTENYYVIGLQTLFSFSDSGLTLYVLGEPIEEPPYIVPPEYQPTTPESPTWGTEWTYTAVALALPFMFMFLPAMMLGHEAGIVGLIIGLCLSISIMYLAGLLPIWTVFLAGLGIIALIFLGRNRIGGSI